MNYRLVLAFLGVSLTLVPTANAATGNERRRWPEAVRFGYVTGVMESWGNFDAVLEEASKCTKATEAPFGPGLFTKVSQCAETRKLTYGQAFAIVEKYMQDNPACWHEGMAGLVWNSMQVACTDVGK